MLRGPVLNSSTPSWKSQAWAGSRHLPPVTWQRWLPGEGGREDKKEDTEWALTCPCRSARLALRSYSSRVLPTLSTRAALVRVNVSSLPLRCCLFALDTRFPGNLTHVCGFRHPLYMGTPRYGTLVTSWTPPLGSPNELSIPCPPHPTSLTQLQTSAGLGQSPLGPLDSHLSPTTSHPGPQQSPHVPSPHR